MNILPNYKEITELLKKGFTIEAQEKIMELREGALELQEDNIKLRERVRQLESELSLSRDFVFDADAGVYWLQKPDSSRDGPFCAVCHDEHKKVARLHNGMKRAAQSKWLCMVCSNTFD